MFVIVLLHMCSQMMWLVCKHSSLFISDDDLTDADSNEIPPNPPPSRTVEEIQAECSRLEQEGELYNEAYADLQRVFDFREDLIEHSGHLIPGADQTTIHQSDGMSHVSDVEGEIDHICNAYSDSFGIVNVDLLYQDPDTLLRCVNRHFAPRYSASKLRAECIDSGLFKVPDT